MMRASTVRSRPCFKEQYGVGEVLRQCVQSRVTGSVGERLRGEVGMMM